MLLATMKPINYLFTSLIYTSFWIFPTFSLSTNAENLRRCTFNDVKCVTNAMNALYPIVVTGKPGVANSSDTLFLSEVNINTANLQYYGQNGALSGLLACVVRKLALISENGTYEFVLVCPRLTIEVSNSATNARFGSKHIVGVGHTKITYVDNVLTFKGYFSSYFDKHYQLYQRVENFVLSLTTQRLFFNFQGLLYCDNCKNATLKTVSQEDLIEYGEALEEPLIKSFMPVFLKNYNEMLATKPVASIYLDKDNY